MQRMAIIAVRNTAPERALRGILQCIGCGPVRANDGTLPGSPDVVLPDAKVAAFAHGCFWHHHAGCRHARVPATSFPWADKFRRTAARDAACRADLLREGWRVVTVWECALGGPGALTRDDLAARLRAFLLGSEPLLEMEGRGMARPGAAA